QHLIKAGHARVHVFAPGAAAAGQFVEEQVNGHELTLFTSLRAGGRARVRLLVEKVLQGAVHLVEEPFGPFGEHAVSADTWAGDLDPVVGVTVEVVRLDVVCGDDSVFDGET